MVGFVLMLSYIIFTYGFESYKFGFQGPTLRKMIFFPKTDVDMESRASYLV